VSSKRKVDNVSPIIDSCQESMPFAKKYKSGENLIDPTDFLEDYGMESESEHFKTRDDKPLLHDTEKVEFLHASSVNYGVESFVETEAVSTGFVCSDRNISKFSTDGQNMDTSALSILTNHSSLGELGVQSEKSTNHYDSMNNNIRDDEVNGSCSKHRLERISMLKGDPMKNGVQSACQPNCTDFLVDSSDKSFADSEVLQEPDFGCSSINVDQLYQEAISSAADDGGSNSHLPESNSCPESLPPVVSEMKELSSSKCNSSKVSFTLKEPTKSYSVTIKPNSKLGKWMDAYYKKFVADSASLQFVCDGEVLSREQKANSIAGRTVEVVQRTG